MDSNTLHKIDTVRAKVLENIQVNNEMYSKLVNEIGIQQYTLAEEFLFDAIFNSQTDDDYKYFLQECQERLKN